MGLEAKKGRDTPERKLGSFRIRNSGNCASQWGRTFGKLLLLVTAKKKPIKIIRITRLEDAARRTIFTEKNEKLRAKQKIK